MSLTIPRTIASVASVVAAAPAVEKKPNLVVVVADDSGWRDTGDYDNAAKGVRFDDFSPAEELCCLGENPTAYDACRGLSSQHF